MLFNTAGKVFFRKLGSQRVLWKNYERRGTSFARGKVSFDLKMSVNSRCQCVTWLNRMESEIVPSSTQKPFEVKPGDEMSPEAIQRAELALRNAKEYSIEGESVENNVFDKLIIKGLFALYFIAFLLQIDFFIEPKEFRNKSFMTHLQNIPYTESILTKKMEEYFYKGLHMTFCRKRDDTLAIVSIPSESLNF